MADTRYLGNRVLRVAVALESAIPFGVGGNPEAPLTTALNSNFAFASPAIRFNGYGFGIQATTQNDDRSLSDAPGARERGFLQAGGEVPAIVPRDYASVSDIAAIFWRLVKKPGEKLWVVTRLSPRGDGVAFENLDEVSVFLVEVDGGQNVSEGTTSRVYTVTWQSAGTIIPNTFASTEPRTAITIGGGTAAATGAIQARRASVTAVVGGESRTIEITNGVTWSVDDDSKAQVIGEGPHVLFTAAGAVSLRASHPAFTMGTKAITVT